MKTMKTGIIYSSHHGTTETVAKEIQSQLQPLVVELVNLSDDKHLDLSNYDVVILGSSIHASHNQSVMQNFCRKNMPELLQKQVGLFLCCMNKAEREQSMQNAYSEMLRNHAFSIQFMGGEYKMDKMNFIERILLKKIAGVTESKSSIDQEAINQFVEKIKEQLMKIEKTLIHRITLNYKQLEKEGAAKIDYRDTLTGFMLYFESRSFV